MNRTEFIRLSAFAAVAISLPLLHSCHASTADDAMANPLFLSRLFNTKQIGKAGKLYLQKTQPENSKSKLISLLADNSDIVNSNDVNAIQQYLGNKVKQDFQNDNTVLVQGWVLSVTEARQYALYALMHGE
jgi:hypothetical protein